MGRLGSASAARHGARQPGITRAGQLGTPGLAAIGHHETEDPLPVTRRTRLPPCRGTVIRRYACPLSERPAVPVPLQLQTSNRATDNTLTVKRCPLTRQPSLLSGVEPMCSCSAPSPASRAGAAPPSVSSLPAGWPSAVASCPEQGSAMGAHSVNRRQRGETLTQGCRAPRRCTTAPTPPGQLGTLWRIHAPVHAPQATSSCCCLLIR